MARHKHRDGVGDGRGGGCEEDAAGRGLDVEGGEWRTGRGRGIGREGPGKGPEAPKPYVFHYI